MPKIKILLVDDDVDFREILRMALTNEAFEIREAGSALEATEILRGGFWPRLIFLDQRMPDMTGATFLTRFWEDFRTQPPCDVILISGDTLTTVPGAAAVLRKPFELEQLRQVTTSLLNTV